MGDFILHRHPGVTSRWAFRCRNREAAGVDYRDIITPIRRSVNNLFDLTFMDDEIEFMATSMKYLHPSYLDFLRVFRLQKRFIKKLDTDGPDLVGDIDGPWLHVSPFETLILPIVSEEIARYYHPNEYNGAVMLSLPDCPPVGNFTESTSAIQSLGPAIAALETKIELARGASETFRFSDFGLRRAFCTDWHDYVIRRLTASLPKSVFVGTSNMYLAKKYGIIPRGTMAHECLSAYQALVRLQTFQKQFFMDWIDHFRGEVGYALSDIIGMNAFLRDFDLYLAKVYDGARQDSGDPEAWGEALIAHYEKLGIPSHHKVAVFSDNLTFPKAIALCNRFSGRLLPSCGIGTNLTNDIPGIVAAQNVIKMIECNGQPVAKLSDSPGKEMCRDADYMTYLRKICCC